MAKRRKEYIGSIDAAFRLLEAIVNQIKDDMSPGPVAGAQRESDREYVRAQAEFHWEWMVREFSAFADSEHPPTRDIEGGQRPFMPLNWDDDTNGAAPNKGEDDDDSQDDDSQEGINS